MDLLDIAFEVTSYLSNNELLTLHLLGLLPHLRALSSNQRWWYERVRAIFSATLNIKFNLEVNWRTTHIVLVRELEKDSPSLWNREDNVMATRLLTAEGFGGGRERRYMIDAAREGSTSLFSYFLGRGIGDRETLCDCLLSAAEYGHQEIVLTLLGRSKPSSELAIEEDVHSEALKRACQARWGNETGNYTRIVQALLPKKLDDVTCCDLIAYACEYDDNADIVKLLLERSTIDVDSTSLLEIVVENGRKLIASLLIELGVSPNLYLTEAVKSGHEMLEFLLERISPGRTDGITALSHAISLEDVRCVDLLLSLPEVAKNVTEDMKRLARRTRHSGIIELLDSASSMH